MHTYRNLSVTVNNAGSFHLHLLPWCKHHSVVSSICLYISFSAVHVLVWFFCAEAQRLSFVFLWSVSQGYLRALVMVNGGSSRLAAPLGTERAASPVQMKLQG